MKTVAGSVNDRFLGDLNRSFTLPVAVFDKLVSCTKSPKNSLKVLSVITPGIHGQSTYFEAARCEGKRAESTTESRQT